MRRQKSPYIIAYHLFFLIFILATFPACQRIQDWWEGSEVEEAETRDEIVGLAYTVSLSGTFPESLQPKLEALSTLFRLREKQPPLTVLSLKRRAGMDKEILTDFLQKQGYFDVSLDIDINDQVDPIKVTLRLEAGGPYTVGQVVFIDKGHPAQASIVLEDLSSRLHKGESFLAETVFALESQIMRYMQEHGYPHAKVEDPLLDVDYENKAVNIQIYYETGPLSNFGATEISGLETLQESFVRNRLVWEEGSVYTHSKIEKARRKLIDSGIFDSVSITPQLA